MTLRLSSSPEAQTHSRQTLGGIGAGGRVAFTHVPALNASSIFFVPSRQRSRRQDGRAAHPLFPLLS